jgi:AraC-like DNA-binding protein
LYYLITVATPDLTFLYGESVPRCTHRIDKQFRDYQTIQYMSGGGVELEIGAERYELRGRYFWSAYPGPRVRFQAARGHAHWAHRYIAFRGPLVSRWTAEGLFPIVVPQRPPGNRDYGKAFDEMLARSARADRVSYLRAVHSLEGMLLDLAEARAVAPVAQAWVGRAMDWLSGMAEEGGAADYAGLAESLGMGESTFRRRFREATGTPPHVYLLQCRVASARRLLAETELPIKEIAGRLHYGDVYFFSRQFKKLAGVPPAVYRKSRQG